MAKSMIKQTLGDKNFTSYVPAGADEAKALAEAVMPGKIEIFEMVSEGGNDNVTDGYKKYSVMLKSEETGIKTYLNLVVPLSKNEHDIQEALKGKTFNGVKADIVYVFSEREYKIDSGSNS